MYVVWPTNLAVGASCARDLSTHQLWRDKALGSSKHRCDNAGWDWFDPKVLPVSPEPQLLTTVWGKMKIQD